MNSWWGKSGGGAPSFTSRRQNVNDTLEHPRIRWVRLCSGSRVECTREVVCLTGGQSSRSNGSGRRFTFEIDDGHALRTQISVCNLPPLFFLSIYYKFTKRKKAELLTTRSSKGMFNVREGSSILVDTSDTTCWLAEN